MTRNESVVDAGATDRVIMQDSYGSRWGVTVDRDGTLTTHLVSDSQSPPTVIDSFEDGDIAEYGGDTGAYTARDDSTIAVDGSWSLEATTTAFTTITSESGLPTYPQQGDEWRVWMRVDDDGGSNSYAGHYFATGNSDNYWARIRPDDNTFQLDLSGSGMFTNSVTIDLGTWYEVRIRWDDGSTFGGQQGDVEATLFDASGTQLSQHLENDTAFTDGGVGFFSANILRADYARLTNR
jgi:hypothetical protein